jgi:mono/diheme cytochrome c family protein
MVLSVFVLLVTSLGVYVYAAYLSTNEAVRYSDPLERYKYQSIGSEATAIPLYIYEVMPSICPARMPADGYAGFGFIYEDGHELPIGITNRTLGVPRAGLNCATCHTGTVRETPDSERMIIVGGPAHQLRLQEYARFLIDCVGSSEFATDDVMREIEARHDLGPIEGLIYRYVVVPQTRTEIAKLQTRLAWADRQPDFGPGRVDAINPIRMDFQMDVAGDDRLGTVDFPSLWDQRARVGHLLQWDGLNDSTWERNVAAAIVGGATTETIDTEELQWTTEFLLDLKSPAYPFPIDEALAARGAPVFEAQCARCHDASGTQVGRTTALDRIGTDPHRHEIFDEEVTRRFNLIGEGYWWQIRGYRRGLGYQNALLDGIWARAPYLHNGSVPNLRELLERPENRSAVFYHGYDVYDQVNLGFVTQGPDAEQKGFRYDTTGRGNSNAGHLFGTDLPDADKLALIEYLKKR